MNYVLKKSKRTTISIYITKDAQVEVHAPLYATKSQVDAIVAEKRTWIQKHLAYMTEKKEKRGHFSLKTGSELLLFGKHYLILDTNEKKAFCDGSSIYLPIGDEEKRKKSAISFYKEVAQNVVNQRVKSYAEKMDVTPKSVSITSAKTRWGSCSGDNRLHFSWRLMMADASAINYVVVHELSHIKEHNHSPCFWQVVSTFCPNFQSAKESLKVVAEILAEEDW